MAKGMESEIACPVQGCGGRVVVDSAELFAGAAFDCARCGAELRMSEGSRALGPSLAEQLEALRGAFKDADG